MRVRSPIPPSCDSALRCSPTPSDTSRTTAVVPMMTPMAVSATRPLRRARLLQMRATKSKNFIVRIVYPQIWQIWQILRKNLIDTLLGICLICQICGSHLFNLGNLRVLPT